MLVAAFGEILIRVRLIVRVAISVCVFASCEIAILTFMPMRDTSRLLTLADIARNAIRFGVVFITVASYFLLVHTVFRQSGRKTAWKVAGSAQTPLLMLFVFGSLLQSAFLFAVAGHPRMPTYVSWICLIGASPVFLWVTLNPRVADAVRKADASAEEQRRRRIAAEKNRRMRRRQATENTTANQIARLRKEYQSRRREIATLPFDDEGDRHLLLEEASTTFRDQVQDLLVGTQPESTELEDMFRESEPQFENKENEL